ncbi:glycosyltransferase family 39 protein [Stackebrandtia endophytica]|uniref:glycosyltransferase family 39 protein n=1 Tax=Stackebrandtia endophytica TaxID=1496996 RepID=UPI0014770DBA|nr:glycosyltransferase family 39 protein [Stackebrandtia endophytica]
MARPIALTRIPVPVLIAVAMLAVGLAGITRPGMWADELATWAAVRLTWPDLFQLLGNTDAVNGGYYLLLKPWTAVAGTSELALRLPATVATVASAALVTMIGQRLGGLRWAIPAGIIFVLLPVVSRYAQEARAYALVVALSLLAGWLLIRSAESGRHPWFIGYAAAVTALGAFHLMGLLLLAGHAVMIVALGGSWRRWLLAVAAAILALTPLMIIGTHQIGQTDWIEPISVAGIARLPTVLFGSHTVAILVLALAAVSILRHRDRLTVALLSWAVAPTIGLLLVAQVSDLWFPRYLLFTMPAWVLLAARAFSSPTWRPRVHGVVLVLILGVVAGAGTLAHLDVRSTSGHGHDTRAVAAVITEHARPGDALVVNLAEPVVPWEARDLVAAYVPVHAQPDDVFALTEQRENGRFLATETSDADVLRTVDRVWVIRFENPPDVLSDLGGSKESRLRADFTVTEHWQLRGLSVALLTRHR